MSIQIIGFLDVLDIKRKKACGWVRVIGDTLKTDNVKPLVTVLIGKKIIAHGLAVTSRPDTESPGALAFGFSLDLTDEDEINKLKIVSDLQVVAEYKGEKESLKIYQPIVLTLQYFLLNPVQRTHFMGGIITNPEQAQQVLTQPPNVLAVQTRVNPPTRKLCVITYVNDMGAWFPYFYKYYSSLVGDTAIYVATPKPDAFDTYKLGGIISCSNMQYDDQARSQLMSGLATGLQAYYQWTLVCDPDEIVVPHPNSKATFFELLEKETNDVIISRGVDIIQMNDEADFSFDEPILPQRRFAIPNIAMCKPHIARKPIQYGPGYHYCNYKLELPPTDEGFLTLHLKFACRRIRKQLEVIALKASYSDKNSAKYATNSISDNLFDSLLNQYLSAPIEDINSSAMQEFEKNYVKNLDFILSLGLWRGKHMCAPFLVKLSSPLDDEYIKLRNFTPDTDLKTVIDGLRRFFSVGTRDEIYPIFLPRVKTPIYLRRGTSDFMNFVQIFVNAEYSPCFSFSPENIIDLGSYIGLSAVYFANRFPDAKIICVEPSVDNYKMLKLNTKDYQNITVIKAGVWSHKTRLKIARQVSGDWGNIVEEANTEDNNTINALSITDIIKEYKLDKIDFLKIDIEGSEKQIFLNNTEGWVDLVKTVACETHDRFIPGCTAAYEHLFKSRGFDYFQSGEFKTFIKREFSLSGQLSDHVKL